MSQDLGQRMRSGALWTYLQGGIGSVIQFAAGIVMARLLMPEDFGVFFAVVAYTALLGAQVNFGLPSALLQAKAVQAEQWNAAFWFMEGLALLCTLMVAASAAWLADFYGDPRYAPIMLFSCVSFFLMPFMGINGSLLRREMDFKTLSQIQIKAKFSGTALGLLAAFAGLGPYSFVVGGLGTSLISAALMARQAPWRPRWNFDREALRPLLRFGWRMHLNNSLSLAANRVDNMLLGRLAGLDLLGIYNRAFSLSRLPIDNLCTPLYQLVFGGLSRIQDNLDHSRLMYQKVLCAVTSAVFPLLLWLIFLVEPLIYYLYGEKWLPAAEPFRYLALGAFVLVISITTSSLASAQNLVARQTPIVATNLLLTIVAVLVGIRWGLTGVAIGIALKMLLTNLLLIRMMRRSHMELGWSQLAMAILPAALSTLAAAGAGWLLDNVLREGLGLMSLDWRYMLAISVTLGGVYILSWLLVVRSRPGNPVLQANLLLLKQLAERLLPRLARIKP
ncbi:lipopolysaccharide biosynthesis protein [Thiohalobacter sp. IOR34]|uniref:lipopolysaccharide biosynthesis protein n=1 Tax=Thiohalobacter sp. IOR34 TaxID=3057176 RepID=UPI0025AF2857|nr:lipopolysaccharide biosynthesis protein [Thiohalobacter sp. IOR34]WJW74439.1 lipopolysaccharide biosynthesis protein [Thiohalobacter sp. IOR34]